MWNRQGTASVANGSHVITGEGTEWLEQGVAWEFVLEGEAKRHEVKRVVSQTQIELVEPVERATASGLSFQIIPTQGLNLSLRRKLEDVNAIFSGVLADFSLGSYQLWLDQGNTGGVEAYLASLVGPQGDDAYQVWLDAGNTGTVTDFFNALSGGAVAATAANVASAIAARDQAEGHKNDALIHRNAAETASANALAAVTYQNLSGAEAVLAVDAVAVWKGVLPYMPAEDIPTSILVVAEASQVTVYSLDAGTPVSWKAGDLTGLTITAIDVSGATLWIGTTTGLVARDLTGDIDASAVDYSTGTTPALVNNSINAVATHTAANAPLNEAGQPISVVCVGTDAGLSVILEDGSTVDSDGAQGVADITVTDVGVWWSREIATYVLLFASWEDIRAGDGFGDQVAQSAAGVRSFDLLTDARKLASDGGSLVLMGSASSQVAAPGVMRHWPNYQDQSKGLSQLQTADYATPLMLGGCKLAALCEADDTDLVGSGSLVANGDFASSDLTGFSDTSTGAGSVAVVSSQLVLTGAGVSDRGRVQSIDFATVVGEAYEFTADIVGLTGSSLLQFQVWAGSAGGNIVDDFGVSASGQYRVSFIATQATTYLRINNYGTGDATLDNLFVQPATADRSASGKGLTINGTVPAAYINGGKTVAYGPFTAADYLTQPYNPDLSPDQGGFISLWADLSVSIGSDHFLDRIGDNTVVRLIYDASNRLLVSMSGGGLVDQPATQDGWAMISTMWDGSNVYLCENDVLLGSDGLNAIPADAGNERLFIGVRGDLQGPSATPISLLTWTAGAMPTPEQLRVKYLAERPRFYGGAVDPTLPEAGVDAFLDPVTGLFHMIGAAQKWAVDRNGLIAPGSLASIPAGHNRITVFDGEVITWEYTP